MRRHLLGTLFALAGALTAAGPAFAQAPARRLQLAFDADGTVTLAAQGVGVRDILAEWARQCVCLVANADRLPATPLPYPLQFEHRPQDEVLRSLLRQAAGFVLTPRRAGSAGPSQYETIYIVASSTPVAAAAPTYAPPVTYTPPTVQAVTPGSPDDEVPPVIPLPPVRGDQDSSRAPQAPATQPQPNRPPSPGVPGTLSPVPIIPIVPITPGAPSSTSTPPQRPN
jgi:hypothetical protein